MVSGTLCSSVIALGKIGPDAKAALPELVEVFGLYLESADFRNLVDAAKSGVGGFGGFRGEEPMAFVVVESILAIDPDAKAALPYALSVDRFRGGGPVVNASAAPEVWRQAHEALRKRYATAQK